jgi:hypothetical protein
VPLCRHAPPARGATRTSCAHRPSSQQLCFLPHTPHTSWPAPASRLRTHHQAQWLAATMAELAELAEACGRRWSLRLAHVERVKWCAASRPRSTGAAAGRIGGLTPRARSLAVALPR